MSLLYRAFKGHLKKIQSKLTYVSCGNCSFEQTIACQMFYRDRQLVFCEAEEVGWWGRRGNKKVSKLWSSIIYNLSPGERSMLGKNWIRGTPSGIEICVCAEVGESWHQVCTVMPHNYTVCISEHKKWRKCMGF